MSTRRRPARLAAATSGLLAAALVPLLAVDPATGAGQVSATAASKPDRATRMVQIVLDQLRPVFIDALDMKNVQKLMRKGASYPRAHLGHMGSETVISHDVMTSGQLPKHMGWSDEWYRAVEGLLGAQGEAYVSGSMSASQFDTLIDAEGCPKLAEHLHGAFPGTIVAAIDERNHAVHPMGGPGADMRITLGSRNADCDEVPDEPTDLAWRGPTGVGVPAYVNTRPATGSGWTPRRRWTTAR